MAGDLAAHFVPIAFSGSDAYIGRMANPASIFDPEDEDAKERAIAAAEALPESDDVPLADVKRWLRSWGTPDELPPPPWK